ncbi:MAG: hypothetical protein M3Z26_06500 [Bacteroidota bacterium]|nr:hypothetical protein [Bacteroidota bacterium]
MKTKITILALITFTLLILSSCGKKADGISKDNNQAIMKMEVTCNGDIQSQVAVLTFLTVNANNSLVNIITENTGNSSAGPFLQNADFSATNTISFHSADKVSSVSIMLALSPKNYATTPDKNFSMTIKIFFDGKLKVNQTFSFDKVSDGNNQTPKDFDYKVTVN